MTTYNFIDGSITGRATAVQQLAVSNEIQVLRNTINCALQTIVSASLAQCIAIPAGTTVLNAFVRIITAETTNATADLGITGVNVDQWGDALTFDSAAGSIIGGTLAAPYYFASAGTIDVLVTTDTADVAFDAAKFEVVAICIKHAI